MTNSGAIGSLREAVSEACLKTIASGVPTVSRWFYASRRVAGMKFRTQLAHYACS
jgi:hypothetical protein